jgi:hypothetical protein
MTELLVYSVAAFGLSWVLADSKISLPFRERLAARASWPAVFLLALVECVACTGFHIGWVGQLLGVAPFAHWYLAAFFTCASNLMLAKYVGMLDEGE